MCRLLNLVLFNLDEGVAEYVGFLFHDMGCNERVSFASMVPIVYNVHQVHGNGVKRLLFGGFCWDETARETQRSPKNQSLS